jgi:hypothetical protein
MTPLITLTDIRSIKSISLNLNQDKELVPNIIEAQEYDLRPILGDNFFLDLVDDLTASPSLVLYSDLWNGSEYTYGGERYKHEGIKTVLAYHAYARYLSGANIQSTATGFVHKTNQYSERVDDKSISRLIAQARSAAQVSESRVREFLNRNSSDYPLWKGVKTKGYSSGMKIRSIG